MRKLYSKLFESYKEFEGKRGVTTLEKAAIFVPIRGRLYGEDIINGAEEKIKLMIVGRAPNGWKKEVIVDSAEDFGKSAKKTFDDSTRSGWVKDAEASGYLLSRSAFWRVSKQIWERLTGRIAPNWIDYIAWSNLYKISNTEGNPSTTMCRAQFECCKELLENEIRIYEPTHIIFVTDYPVWFADKYSKGKICSFDDRNVFDLKYNSNGIVEAYGTLKADSKTKVVVTKRPESLNNTVFVDEVMKYFES